MTDTVRLVGPRQRDHAHRLIDCAPDGNVMKLGEETRRDAQNSKLWAMIEDVRRCLPEARTFTKEQMKLRFMDALGEEMAYLPKLEGAGFFPVGLSSSVLTVSQFRMLIDVIDRYGNERGVRWTDPSIMQSA